MAVLTIRTSLAVSLWSARDSFAANPWAVILGLGNIAMSFYFLIQLFRLKPEQSAKALLWR